jgi:hypothetical protein
MSVAGSIASRAHTADEIAAMPHYLSRRRETTDR